MYTLSSSRRASSTEACSGCQEVAWSVCSRGCRVLKFELEQGSEALTAGRRGVSEVVGVVVGGAGSGEWRRRAGYCERSKRVRSDYNLMYYS